MTTQAVPPPPSPGAPAVRPGRTAPGHTTPGHTSPGATAAGHTAPGHDAPGRTAPRWTTPTRLRVAIGLCVLAGLLVAVVGWRAAATQVDGLSRARTQSTQLVTLLGVRNDLVAADATATTAFLVGGLEPEGSRQEYTARVAAATSALATVSVTDSAGIAQLAAVSTDLTTYAGLIEQARAANRQGFPVGLAYLDQASVLMRGSLLPELDALTTATADDAAHGFDTVHNASLLALLLLVGLGALVATHAWDTRRTRRVLNPALAGAVVVCLAGGLVGLGLVTVRSHAAQIRGSSYLTSVAVAQATADAYDARSLESATLLHRGSGAPYQAQFIAAVTRAQTQLARLGDDDLSTDLTTWLTAHQKIRALDDAGSWDDAVAAALATGDGTAAAAFTTFTDAASGTLAREAAATSTDLAHQETSARLVGWALVVAGLAAAVLAWRGLSRRLEEYR